MCSGDFQFVIAASCHKAVFGPLTPRMEVHLRGGRVWGWDLNRVSCGAESCRGKKEEKGTRGSIA